MASVTTLPSSETHAYQLYPAPPPTTNQLSTRQKAQLRRSTTKLGKVLGTTPHLVDTYPGPGAFHSVCIPIQGSAYADTTLLHMFISLFHFVSCLFFILSSSLDPITVAAPRPLNSGSRHDLVPSTSSQSQTRPRRLSHRRTKSERTHPDSFPLSSSMQHHRTSAPVAPRRLSIEATYPGGGEGTKRPPTLHIHTGTPRSSQRYSHMSGVPYPASSSSSHSKASSRTTLNDEKPLPTYAIPRKPVPPLNGQTPARDSLCDSLYEPNFTIPSEAAMRRAKMDRVRKLLGEGVPVHLVFPNESCHDEEAEDDDDDDESVYEDIGLGILEKVTKPESNKDKVSSRLQRRASEQVYPLEKSKSADKKRTSTSSPSKYRVLRLDRLSRDSKTSNSTCTSTTTPLPSSGASNSSCSSSYSSPVTPVSSNPSSPITATPSHNSHHHHNRSESYSSYISYSNPYAHPSPLPTPTAGTFQDYAVDAGLASPSGRREFAVYIPKQHAQRRGSVSTGGKRMMGEYELVRGFGNLGI